MGHNHEIKFWFSFGNNDAQNQNQQGTVYGNDDDDEDLYG